DFYAIFIKKIVFVLLFQYKKTFFFYKVRVLVKITIFFTNKSAVLSKNKNNLQEKHLILTEFTVFYLTDIL
ncbi:hypothetical protein, partial [Enterococcus faecalis]|uniref:hypothetical protein n=2 Tax=Enterococcus faecalis TaxID=1351 RepID=UPI000A1776E0